MEKLISISLQSEEQAFEASQKMMELAKNGEITIKEIYILNKEESGEVHIKNAKKEALSYTATGALAGSFIGILGGPIGVLFGMTSGLFAGSIGDLLRLSRSSRFIEKASKAIPSGQTTILAHVFESWEVPLNVSLNSFDAEIKRLRINAEVEKYIAEELQSISEELDELRAKAELATAEEKEKIEARIAELENKRQAFQADVKEELNDGKSNWNQWLEKVKKNFSNWRADLLDNWDDSKEELLDDYKDIKEDYRELSLKIKLSLKRLANSTEESFKNSVHSIKKDIAELDEDIHELGQAIEQLAQEDKARWTAKFTKLKADRDELLAKAKLEFASHQQKHKDWLTKIESDLKS